MSRVKVPPPDPNAAQSQLQMAEIARQAEARAADNDLFFRENLLPRYMEQMDEQIAQGRQAQEFNQGLARSAEERAAAQDSFYRETLMPKVLGQADEQIRMGRELQDFNLGLAKRYDQRYWDTTAKQQDAFYRQVDEFDSQAARDTQRGRLFTDIDQQVAAAEQQLGRGLARRGVNSGSAAAIAAMNDNAMTGALAKVQAGTIAEEAARKEGLNLRAMAAGLGGNLTGASAGFAGAAAGAAGLGMAGLGAAQNSIGANNAQWQAGMGMAGNAWGSALAAGNAGFGALNSVMGGLGNNNSMWNSSMGVAGNMHNSVMDFGMKQQQMKFQANQANAQATNQMIGMAAGMMMSDRRLKKNVELVGVTRDGLGVYEFNYVWGGPRHRGVMADEVLRVKPQAVSSVNGFLAVDYTKIGA